MALVKHHRADELRKDECEGGISNDHQIQELAAGVSVCVSAVSSCFNAKDLCSSDNRCGPFRDADSTPITRQWFNCPGSTNRSRGRRPCSATVNSAVQQSSKRYRRPGRPREGFQSKRTNARELDYDRPWDQICQSSCWRVRTGRLARIRPSIDDCRFVSVRRISRNSINLAKPLQALRGRSLLSSSV